MILNQNANTNHFFSIITICLNPGEFLNKTVESVLQQSCNDWELIIKDGCSVDSSLYFLSDIKNKDIKIIIQPDNGIYEAMNQAIIEATGKYILFLNAGDILSTREVLHDVKSVLINSYKNADIIYGNYVNANNDKCILPQKMSKAFLYSSFLCHQAVFYKNENYMKYDESYKLLGDHDLHLYLFISNCVFKHVNIPICKYQGGGISEKLKDVHKSELKKIRKKYYTKTECFKYELLYRLTFPKVRRFLSGEHAPVFLRKQYRRLVTILRRG